MSSPLAQRVCTPVRPGTPPLSDQQVSALLAELGGGWEVAEDNRLYKEFGFKDFAEALAFVNRVGAVAEEQDHHPDITLAWGKATLTLWTHSIGGLSENDFILAARADGVL